MALDSNDVFHVCWPEFLSLIVCVLSCQEAMSVEGWEKATRRETTKQCQKVVLSLAASSNLVIG